MVANEVTRKFLYQDSLAQCNHELCIFKTLRIWSQRRARDWLDCQTVDAFALIALYQYRSRCQLYVCYDADWLRRPDLFGIYLESGMMDTLLMLRKQVIESIETASHRRLLCILTSPTDEATTWYACAMSSYHSILFVSSDPLCSAADNDLGYRWQRKDMYRSRRMIVSKCRCSAWEWNLYVFRYAARRKIQFGGISSFLRHRPVLNLLRGNIICKKSNNSSDSNILLLWRTPVAVSRQRLIFDRSSYVDRI